MYHQVNANTQVSSEPMLISDRKLAQSCRFKIPYTTWLHRSRSYSVRLSNCCLTSFQRPDNRVGSLSLWTHLKTAVWEKEMCGMQLTYLGIECLQWLTVEETFYSLHICFQHVKCHKNLAHWLCASFFFLECWTKFFRFGYIPIVRFHSITRQPQKSCSDCS